MDHRKGVIRTTQTIYLGGHKTKNLPYTIIITNEYSI